MFNACHYVPVLKGKEGELGGLGDLTPLVRSRLTPLVEATPVDWDFAASAPKKTLDDHLAGLGRRLATCWGTAAPIFLDLHLLPPGDRMSGGAHPMDAIAADARTRGVGMIPVTGLRRDAAYQSAVTQAQQTDGRGVCVRLQPMDFTGSNVGPLLELLLSHVRVGKAHVDLIVDLGAFLPDQVGLITTAAVAYLNAVPDLLAWRSITLIGASFPQNLSGVPPNSVSRIVRAEWAVCQAVQASAPALPRLPTYGDYGISHPDLSAIDPRIMQMSANIRYTADQTWLIVKGRSVKQHTFAQYTALCQTLVGQPEFSGPAYSWGDTYIAQCAIGQVSTGNATVWRKVGNTHHLTLVTDQIATLCAS